MNFYLRLLLCFFIAEVTADLDLDLMEQSFILEAKRMHIQGYPDAFNPSIVKWNNRFLMSFRSRDSTNKASLVGLTWLDQNFNPVGKPQLLNITGEELANLYIQDPRLIEINGKLYMAYSDLCDDPIAGLKKRKMCIAELEYDGVLFWANNRDCILNYQGDRNNKFEKNWVPFDYEGIMLLAYSISPHRIFLPLMGERKCVTFAQSQEFNSWSWGVLRGGTPALLIDNHYLAFFHSSETLTTKQSDSQSMVHYFMGAYIFENQPPFSVKKISPEPIVSKVFYNGEEHPTWKPLRVIFPCGFVYDSKHIWISLGRQDHEAWIIKLDKGGLLKSLIPFESNF